MLYSDDDKKDAKDGENGDADGESIYGKFGEWLRDELKGGAKNSTIYADDIVKAFGYDGEGGEGEDSGAADKKDDKKEEEEK